MPLYRFCIICRRTKSNLLFGRLKLHNICSLCTPNCYNLCLYCDTKYPLTSNNFPTNNKKCMSCVLLDNKDPYPASRSCILCPVIERITPDVSCRKADNTDHFFLCNFVCISCCENVYKKCSVCFRVMNFTNFCANHKQCRECYARKGDMRQ